MGRFSGEDPIFETQEPLRDHYSPDGLQEREDKLNELVNALQPVMKQEAPENVLVYGSQGIGKTESVKHILEELKEDVRESHGEELTKVHIQCREFNSTYQLVIKIAKELREKRGVEDSIAETGLPKRVVYNQLYDELDKAGSYVILVLDEFDEIKKDRDEFLRNLSRALSEDKVTETKPGIITITNDYRFVESLKPETKDSLDAEEISFQSYNPSQLQEILETRAKKAFKPDALGEGVLEFCAAMAGKHQGSARRACQLLRESGKIARDKDPDAESVQRDHVEKAEQQLFEERLKAGLRDLDHHAHFAVLSLIRVSSLLDDSASNSPQVSTKEVYRKYKRFIDAEGGEPLSTRRFKDRLDQLERKGYTQQSKTYEDGHSALHELDVDLETVVSALEESENQFIVDQVEKLREDAEEKSLISASD